MVRPLAIGVALFVVLSGAGAVVSGTPTASSADPSADAPSASTVQQAPEGTTATETGTANESEQRQFDLSIENISECGLSCRDVTVSAVNTGNTTAQNVTVETQLEAGETVVWRGNDSVSELEPNESSTVTKRVQLGPFEAYAVQQNDGYLTANTTVTWDGGNETFTERRKVA